MCSEGGVDERHPVSVGIGVYLSILGQMAHPMQGRITREAYHPAREEIARDSVFCDSPIVLVRYLQPGEREREGIMDTEIPSNSLTVSIEGDYSLPSVAQPTVESGSIYHCYERIAPSALSE